MAYSTDPYFSFMADRYGPSLDPHADYMNSLNNSSPAAVGAAGSNLGMIGDKAIGAAGTTIGAIANIAGQVAARDTQNKANELDRAQSATMAKMQLADSALGSNQARQMTAYELLQKAYGGQMANLAAARDNARHSAGSLSDLYADAILAHRG